eukprot:178030-Chlamydomonas_euryale.AAC.11
MQLQAAAARASALAPAHGNQARQRDVRDAAGRLPRVGLCTALLLAARRSGKCVCHQRAIDAPLPCRGRDHWPWSARRSRACLGQHAEFSFAAAEDTAAACASLGCHSWKQGRPARAKSFAACTLGVVLIDGFSCSLPEPRKLRGSWGASAEPWQAYLKSVVSEVWTAVRGRCNATSATATATRAAQPNP